MGEPSVAHYRHARIGFADIADKRPGLPLTGEYSAGRKLLRAYLDYQMTIFCWHREGRYSATRLLVGEATCNVLAASETVSKRFQSARKNSARAANAAQCAIRN